MKKLMLFVMVFCLVPVIGHGQAKLLKSPEPLVQLALLLDTSNSMDGLIDQAKSQLWKIVNELALAKRDDRGALLNVALFEYGNSRISSGEGHIRMVVPLTTDLDKISEELFKLKTNGGDEYCGQVIQSSVNGLQWSANPDDLKIIVIAGNEPFTQGTVDYRNACQNAIRKSIIVNTIFCGNYQEGINTKWKAGADLADGKYMNIDQNKQVVHIDAPQDGEIEKLGRELNETYVSYGKKGEESKQRQAEQDSQASSITGVMAARSVTKASRQYKNVEWDLVDAQEEGAVAVEDLDADELPEEMRGMDKSQRKAYVEKMGTKRKTIQTRIRELHEEREKYVAGQLRNLPADTLDAVLIDAVRKQAESKSFRFEK